MKMKAHLLRILYYRLVIGWQNLLNVNVLLVWIEPADLQPYVSKGLVTVTVSLLSHHPRFARTEVEYS